MHSDGNEVRDEVRDKASAGWRTQVRRWLPPLGTIALVTYLVWSTDLDAAAAAFRQADVGLAILVLGGITVITWLYDGVCLTWLIGLTLGHRGTGGALRLRDVLPIKAASYVLNIVNYNAATVGMAWIVSRRKRVGMIESLAALAVLSYIDLVALTALLVLGLVLSADALSSQPELVERLTVIAVAVFGLALTVLLLLQSPIRNRWLDRLRSLAILRPIAAVPPRSMLMGVAMRMLFVMGYVANTYGVMLAFGMSPRLDLLLLYVPILSVVGVVPLSISGLGTTQILMRTFYAPMVADGRVSGPVIDAFSTVVIIGFILTRLAVALPFLPRILKELRERPDSASGTEATEL